MRAVASLALILGLVGCKKPEDGAGGAKAPPTPPVKVTTAVASEAPTPDTLTLTGMIAADQRADVTADTQGKVVNVMIERGQKVKLGQPVVQLDVRTSALSAREAQANLEAARAQKQLADQECARTKALLEKGAITQSEYDRQITQCTAALQQVSAAQARTEMMTKSVADGLVRAPFDGVISEKMVSPGEWVAPGKALFTLVKDDPLRIELSVPEKAVSSVKQGQTVELATVAFPDKVYAASVTRIGAEVGRSRSLIVEATIDKGSDLVPGMFAEAHLVVGHSTRVVLPREAVVRRGKQWHAFVVNHGEAEDRIVQLGAPPSPDKVAIADGVNKGDKVVVKVPDTLADGSKVTE
jgi:membrane fusion protein (multidrug efflux system)